MLGNWHVPCGVGEKLEITSNAYLLLTVSLICSVLKFGYKKREVTTRIAITRLKEELVVAGK
ncbi:hypothetical protein PB01_17405 [Psychrobacillus glaciei]|uniref:Uncharacterized protein n=1 Tax=Psychrobacillus glaciei TaxID=2283160 RepID=A0A5J6STZ1_9BACI|nr:hypothetical protein [Psychrobacillus glaciei]QFG00435.1 hypothetical protein PB01_17405 [Psychrobacillus glaciei]